MKSLQIEEQAKQIQKYVLKLQKDMDSYQETFARIGNSLSSTVNHYNAGKKRLEIIDKDIIKINPDLEQNNKILETVDTPQ